MITVKVRMHKTNNLKSIKEIVMAKPFKKWMAEARRQAKQGDCRMIGELYKVMAKNDLKYEELDDLFNEMWVDSNGEPLYDLTQADKDHLDILHDKTCVKWHLEDTDY